MHINYWAVLVSAVVSMVIGSIWFGPLFGKMFMHEMGMDQWSPEKQEAMKKQMNLSYFLQFLASCAMFYVLAYLIVGLNQMSTVGGIKIALLTWIGFAVPQNLGNAAWGGSWKMFWLGIGNSLITGLVVGSILGSWR